MGKGLSGIGGLQTFQEELKTNAAMVLVIGYYNGSLLSHIQLRHHYPCNRGALSL